MGTGELKYILQAVGLSKLMDLNVYSLKCLIDYLLETPFLEY